MTYLVGFVLAILILVFFHELGHFLVARLSGIKVLTFSIGFGPKLCSFKDRLGTEYQLAAFPIGGYVRMLGEDEFAERPTNEDSDQAFCNAHASRKVAVAAAGPFASLLLGFIIFYVILITGTKELDAYVGEVADGSPVMQAGMQVGERIRSVDDRSTKSWTDVNLALADRLGDTGTIEIETDNRTYFVEVSNWLHDQVEPDLLATLGLGPEFRAHIAEVASETAAERAGFEVGDHITHINHNEISNWPEVAALIQANPERPMVVTVDRNGRSETLRLVPQLIVADDGSQYGLAGIRPEIGRNVRYGVLEAIPLAFVKTVNLITLSGESIYKMVMGDVHIGNLGGPVRIAEYAGDLVSLGLEPYLTLLAALTIALGLINLLPIPMLDGGHIVFGLIEWGTRKPIPVKVQAIGMRIGLFLVGCLMIFALFNDVNRLLAS